MNNYAVIGVAILACIERWGRGTLDMIQDCKKAGNPLPIFAEVGGFSVTLPLKEPMRTVVYEKSSELSSKLTDRQKNILKVLEKSSLTAAQINAALENSIPERTLRFELAKLKKMGILTSHGKTKSTMWHLTSIRQ